MRKQALAFIFCPMLWLPTRAQDTFSILAFDSISGEIGAAGASCIDLFLTNLQNDDFIAEILPDTGAIMTQAYYQPANQAAARTRLRAGDDPAQVISWLQANDVQNNPHIRQYGVVKPGAVGMRTAAHTGTNANDYKSHIVGPNYTIQGNILLGQQVLDSMEARFLREKGDLSCKLMAAMQGAKMPGADTRCMNNGTSSYFAFLKVCLPTDPFGSPYFKISVRTATNTHKEPIDSLQQLFDQLRICVDNTSGVARGTPSARLSIHPSPFTAGVSFSGPPGQEVRFIVSDIWGRPLMEGTFHELIQVDLGNFSRGLYIAELRCGGESLKGKMILY